MKEQPTLSLEAELQELAALTGLPSKDISTKLNSINEEVSHKIKDHCSEMEYRIKDTLNQFTDQHFSQSSMSDRSYFARQAPLSPQPAAQEQVLSRQHSVDSLCSWRAVSIKSINFRSKTVRVTQRVKSARKYEQALKSGYIKPS